MIVKAPCAVRIVTGGEEERVKDGRKYKALVSWGHGKVYRVDNDREVLHEDFFRYSEDGTFTEFLIEFRHNLPAAIFQSHLVCRDGRSIFCSRMHRAPWGGDDVPGYAKRRWIKGGVATEQIVECSPDLCDLRALHLRSTKDGQAELPEAYSKIYGKGLTIGKTPPKCMPTNSLLFSLMYPDESGYAHNLGETAMLQTHSDTTHGKISNTLREWNIACGNRLAGIRCWLRVHQLDETRFGRPVHYWELHLPTDKTIQQLKQEAADRRSERAKNYDALPTDAETRDLVLAVEQREYLNQLAEQEDQAASLAAQAEYAIFSGQYLEPGSIALSSQNIYVIRMAARLGYSYAKQVAIPLFYGNDVWTVMYALKATADKAGIPTADIMQDYEATLPPEMRTKPAPPEPATQTPADEPQDADFTELPPDPQPDVKDDLASVTGSLVPKLRGER